ncbi:hypothetical protein M885DRAFT_191961 [Pelagophyceae sp. CCMP2097]|nr:hypothetical protein M885DRAFT_191961 [Pelagophyceae sp. CCMP2097]
MLHRKKLLSNGEVCKNAFGATEPIIRSTLDRHAKALTLLFRFQVAQGQLPADAPAPNDGGALTDIKQRLSKSTATNRKKNYLPRGKATVKVDYSNAQHLQLCHYGLICTAEFAEYSKELLAAMADLRLTLDEMAARGDAHTAQVLGVVLNAQAAAPAAAAAGLSPGARAELRDVHAVVCPRDAPAPRSLFAPEHLAAPPLAPLTAAFDVKIVATWPTDAVPLFASGFDLAEYTSPEAVTKEWLFGRDDRQPAVKHLEAYYGPAKGALVKGLSWRNKQWAADASNKKDKAFAMRKPAFDYIEKHGEAAAVAEMHRLLSEYDGPKRPWRAMQHVLKQMRDARPGADARATIGAKGAATRALKRKRTDAAPKRQRTDASPAP